MRGDGRRDGDRCVPLAGDGFDAVAAFTHNIENVYDLVRSGGFPVTPELISLTLNARDHILHLLEATVSAVPVAEATGSHLLAAFEKLVGAPAAQPGAAHPALPNAAAPSLQLYTIRFVPPPGLFARGANLLPLFDELRGLGDLTITTDSSALPPLAELEPDHCYLAFDMLLRAACPPEAIRDVFVFVDEGDSLTITVPPPPGLPERRKTMRLFPRTAAP